jgi:two-component system, response regulator RegA
MNRSAIRERSHTFPGRSVLIIDDQNAFVRTMSASFRKIGFAAYCAPDLASAQDALGWLPRDVIVVSELKLGGRSILFDLAKMRGFVGAGPLVIVTSYPSVATATRAVRLGVDAYLAKPVTARRVLSTLYPQLQCEDEPEPDVEWPTLNRTIWEYLNQVFVGAGSMSEAARRLGLDRRSLRRMLARSPPAR